MVKGKGVTKPSLQFLGVSAYDVAGSVNLLRFKKYCTLLDAGWAQGFDIMTAYKTNKETIKKLKPKEIDYCVVTHLNLDHHGLIPALFAKGCQSHIYITQGSTKFLRLLWEDSLKIHLQDCQKLQNKHGIKATPLYTQRDIEKALNRVIEIPYNTLYKVNDSMTLTFYSAGHIIHSAQALIEMREGSIIKRIGYGGDIGGKSQPYVEPREKLPFVDIYVGEATYCVPSRPDKARDREKDIEKIQSAIKQFNKILIPAFSLQRTQCMLKLLHDKIDTDDIPIYLDSPLASRICAIWDDSKEWENIMNSIHVITSPEDSIKLQQSNENCIIISASGFLAGGKIMSHLKAALDKPSTCVLFVGYAGENNLASQIKAGQKEVNIDGMIVKNNANIIELRSFSSHASYEELMSYYQDLRYDRIVLHHGEMEGKVTFAQTLQQSLINQGKSARVIACNMDTKIYF